MILEKQKEAMIVTDGDEVNESIGMSLDLDSAQILMQMLSKNLYSDAIGSTIRETVSNSIDSHRKAGIDDPVIVRFSMNARNEYEFSVEDFGVGLNADDVRNIISKYGKSTKRDSNLFIGAMGLGWKSPLAYSSSFHFICRKDGMERKYMMYEGEEVNTIDLLSEEATSERNGVKVVVPVRWVDRQVFYDKIKEQLAYFENVYFDVSVNGHTIPNNFKIYRGEHFQYSELIKDNHLHICLDNVYYPIDFAKLGISVIEFPVALRFSLSDGLFPTPNREALKYTQEAKEIILTRIEQVADYFIDRYNQSIEECNDFFKIHEHYSTKDRNVNVIEGVKMNIRHLTVLGSSSKTISKPKLKGVEILNLENLSDKYDSLMREYETVDIFNNGMFKKPKRWHDRQVNLNKFTGSNSFIVGKNIPEVKKKYLKDTLNGGRWYNYYFIRKYSRFGLFPDRNIYNSEVKDYYTLLDLKKIERKDWRKAIVEFQSILESIVNGFKKVDDIVVPDSYLQQYKNSNSRKTGGIVRRQKMSGDIVVKKAVNLERFVDGKSCKFVPETWKLKDIAKIGHIVVYAHHDEQNKLDGLYAISNGAHKLSIISLSSREMKTLEEMQFVNVMTFEKFMEGNNMPFKRLVTAYLINKLKIREGSLFRRIDILKNVNSEMMNSLKKLDDYNNNYYKSHHSLYKQMLETAQKNNLFDYFIYLEYVKMEKTLEKLYFLNTLLGMLTKYYLVSYGKNDVEIRILIDLFKRHKERVNLELYSCSTIENQ
jgi:hypothetical protein